MHRPELLRCAVACVAAGLWLGSSPSSAQRAPGSLESRLEQKRQQLSLLEGQIGTLVNREREMRNDGTVALTTGGKVVYMDRGELRANLRQFVLHKAVVQWGVNGDYAELGKLRDARWIDGQVMGLEREIVAESDAFFRRLTESRAQMEAEIRLLREQIHYLEEQIRVRDGGAPPPQSLPPGSTMPGGVMGQLEPASRRVCPSPLFGQVLWSASGARCVGADHAMFPGWRFANDSPVVCAKCTPNCSFMEEPSGRLFCAVASTWVAPQPRTGAGQPPAPPGPRPSPGGQSPEDIAARRKALGQELERLRVAGNWNPDHHYQVGVWLGNAANSLQLDAVETLMYDFDACYRIYNAERARISDAAKAGRYATPGDRIGAQDRASRSLNACLDAARARRQAAIGR